MTEYVTLRLTAEELDELYRRLTSDRTPWIGFTGESGPRRTLLEKAARARAKRLENSDAENS